MSDNGLGDNVKAALSAVGITDDRVTEWLGRPCGCAERVTKLNAIGSWANRIISGKVDGAKKYLDRIIRSK